ncbi:hypothetical protein FRC12_002243 [Ceratobasidium sp. 428]|nr:hypothetical protein FRC12_002243 [Ceratobasidium sp. 428]
MTTPHRPWSPHPPAHYQEPTTDPHGVENYLQAQATPQSYYDPYAAQSNMPSWQPAPYNPQRQSTLPAAPGYGAYSGHHQQQPTDTSVEALDLAEYSSRLNAQSQSQPQFQVQPQMYHAQPANYYHPASYPQSAYPVLQSHPAQPQYDYNQTHTQREQARSPPRDFIDSGPFSYTGVREMSPPPVRIPPPSQARPASAPRHQSPTPAHSPRGHLPWATENDNEHDIGEPDPVFPPSPGSPRRADSTNTFPFNVQQAAATESNVHTATSETLHESRGNAPNSTSPDPEMGKDEKDWGVREGVWPGDIGPDGKLISNGPRVRIAVRVLEACTAAGAITACIYAFAVPKPNPAAPPASKPAVYVIVVLGFFTLLAMAYIYILRGCFGFGQKDRDDLSSHAMVLPISRHRAGPRGKGKKHRKGDDSIQVNLIVDPSMFSPGQRESNLTPGVPWTEQQAANSNGVFTSFERERARLSARKGLWWALGLDVLGAVVWAVAFVLAMIGPKCPVSGYSGWCDAYNGAVACACIGSALFVTSAVLVGRDLMVSRKSERKLR